MIERKSFPFLGIPKVERDLEFRRKKPRSLLLSFGYRLYRLARWVFGDKRLLPFLLDFSWLMWRLAYELSLETIGPEFPNQTYGISEKLLKEWVPERGSVIDVGCGSGRLCKLVAPYASRVLGIDYDQKRIAFAKAHIQLSNVEFRVGDVREVLGGERFNVAFLVGVLEHIEDVDALLKQLHQISERLIVEVPDFGADSLNLVRRDYDRIWYSDADHVREYTPSILVDQLSRNGWNILHTELRGGMVLAVASA